MNAADTSENLEARVACLKDLSKAQAEQIIDLKVRIAVLERSLEQERAKNAELQAQRLTVSLKPGSDASGPTPSREEGAQARWREWLQVTPPLSTAGSSKYRRARVEHHTSDKEDVLDSLVPRWAGSQRGRAAPTTQNLKRKASPESPVDLRHLRSVSRHTPYKRPRVIPEVVVPAVTPELRRLHAPRFPPPSVEILEKMGKEVNTPAEIEQDDCDMSSLSSMSSLTELSTAASRVASPAPEASSGTGAAQLPELPPFVYEQLDALLASLAGGQHLPNSEPPPAPLLSPPQLVAAIEPGPRNGRSVSDELVRGPRAHSRELSYVDWPVWPPPPGEEALAPSRPPLELPPQTPPHSDSTHGPRAQANMPVSPPDPSQPRTLASTSSVAATVIPTASSVPEVAPQPIIEPRGAPTIARPFSSLPSRTARGGDIPPAKVPSQTHGSTQAGPSRPLVPPAQQKELEDTRQARPIIAGVKVKLGSPLMDDGAARGRLDGALRYEVEVDRALHAVLVDRAFVSERFGGSPQPLCVCALDGSNMMFPTLAMDPDLPREFGMPGLLCRAGRAPQWREGVQRLFVGLKPGHFRYLGEYELTLSTPLSTEEYRAWAPKIKTEWAEAILGKLKHKDIRVGIAMRRDKGREATEAEVAAGVVDAENAYKDLELDEIIRSYEDGSETMFIWRLQCIRFDEEFLRHVARERTTWRPKPRAPRK